MAAVLEAITDSVHFAYTDLVNWTLVTDGDGVILIDAGFPGSRDDVVASLRELGFGVDDLRAILLTHAHIDHFGSAIWFAKTHGTPVYCHAAEVGHSKREYLEQASPLDIAKRIWQPRYAAWSVAITRKGALTHDGIPSTQALTEDVAAGPPGTPADTARSWWTGCWSVATLWSPATPCCRATVRNSCRGCSTMTRTGVCAAWPPWGCSTPRCCCRVTA